MADLQDVPDLSMKHLRTVVALARFGSFIAAASYLRMSQPGVSRIVQQAEIRLGVKLFARGTRRVSQTEAGREFIPAADGSSASSCSNRRRPASSTARCAASSSLRA